MSKETRTYATWRGMKDRCSNPNYKGFSRYGGRGIKVCERWQKFANFLADMGERPEGKTLDRIDNDGSYEPSNCRWATAAEQKANSSGRRDLTGSTFGRLTPMKASHVSSRGEAYWHCRCACGSYANVRSGSIKNGHTKSCGCLHREHAQRMGKERVERLAANWREG